MRQPGYPLPGVCTGQRTLNRVFDLSEAVADELRHQPAAGNNPVGSPVELRPAVALGCEIEPFELFDLDDHCGKVAKPRF